MATAFNLLVKVGGSAGTDCDYTSLDAADGGAAFDLSATTATRVYSGSMTAGDFTDGLAVTLYRGGVAQDCTGTCHHVAYLHNQMMVRGIAGAVTPAADDEWRNSSPTNRYTISSAGDSVIYRVSCSTTGAADTTAVSWSSSVVSTSSNYIELCAAAGHEAGTVWNTSKYRIEPDNAVALGLYGSGVRVTSLQIGITNATGGTQYPLWFRGAGVQDFRASRCLIRGTSVNYLQGTIYAGGVGDAGSAIRIWNNIIYDTTGLEGTAIYCSTGANCTLYYYSNTIVDCVWGIRIASTAPAAMYVFDNLVKCSGENFRGTFTDVDTNCNYNASSTTDNTGGTNDRVSQSFQFVNETGNNFALAGSDDGARDHGVDPGTYASGALDFEDDFLGTARPQNSTWDIGAVEYILQTGAITVGSVAIAGTVTIEGGGTEITATGAITVGSIAIAGASLMAPTALLCEGATNPTNVTDLTPEFSAVVSPLSADAAIIEVQIQVSAAGDSDFSETLSWDSGWITISPAIDQPGIRTNDISYGAT